MPEKVTQWGFSKDQFAVVARWMARAEAAEAEVARLRATEPHQAERVTDGMGHVWTEESDLDRLDELEAEAARLRAERDEELSFWQDSAKHWERLAHEQEARAAKAEARAAALEAERNQETQLRREAERHLTELKAYCDTQPFPDDIDRAVTERTAENEQLRTLVKDALHALAYGHTDAAMERLGKAVREFPAPTRTQEARCGKPIEDDCPCALDAGHDGPCWPGHSWG